MFYNYLAFLRHGCLDVKICPVNSLKLKLKLKLVYLHHRYITIKIIGINYYMLQKRDPRSKCF